MSVYLCFNKVNYVHIKFPNKIIKSIKQNEGGSTQFYEQGYVRVMKASVVSNGKTDTSVERQECC